MKEEIKKITSLIQKIDEKENFNDYQLLGSEIKETLLNTFLNTSKDTVFITAINLAILNPIQKKISEANRFIETKKSRSYRGKRIKMLAKKDFLIDLRNEILIDYKEQFKETIHYNEFLTEKTKNRFLILNPTQDYPIELFTHIEFENILIKSFEATVSYFDNQLIINTNYKDELFSFVSGTNTEIKKISNELITLKNRLKKYNNEDIDFLFNISNEIQLLNLQKDYLLKTIKKLESIHLFLKIYKPKKDTPLTVFNDRDTNKLENLYFELEYFLDKSTELDDIINVFSLDFEPVEKIDLKNGTTNDFAYLMNKMQPYFIDVIGDRREYNQWWAVRFTFNNAKKTKIDIGRMRSNTKKDLSRLPSKPARIASIVDVLR